MAWAIATIRRTAYENPYAHGLRWAAWGLSWLLWLWGGVIIETLWSWRWIILGPITAAALRLETLLVESRGFLTTITLVALICLWLVLL